jgi:uncharacterized repeat protein (TIGR01451 family)
MRSFVALMLAFSATLCVCIDSNAQDIRVRIGSYFGGGTATCVDEGGNFLCPGGTLSATFPATTHVTVVTKDASGNIYIAGDTNAASGFPITSNAYSKTVAHKRSSYDGPTVSSDSFVAKFGPNGNLVWSTYLGVPTPDFTPAPDAPTPVEAIAVDASGNVTVAGTTFVDVDCRCSNTITPPFILKLNPAGSSITRPYYNEVFGPQNCADGPGNVVSPLTGAAIDSAGHVFLTGRDYPWLFVSGTFTEQCLPPPTTGANQTGTAYVAQVDTNLSGNGRVYIALLSDAPRGIAADSSRHAYVAGKNITRFETNGAITFSKTYIPSFATGSANAVAVTGSGDILFTGNASPQGAFPATKSFGTITTGSDAFVGRLNSTGGLIYSEVIHDAHMTPFAIARDSANEPFVTGKNSGYQYSVNRYSTAPSAGAFLLRGNSTGTSLWLDSTFGGDVGLGIFVDTAWNAFVVGSVVSGEYFPLRSAYQTSFKGAAVQGFLAKLIIEADLTLSLASASPNPVAHGANLTYSFSVLNNGPDVSDGDTLRFPLPPGTTFVSFTTTNGSCTGSGGVFNCARNPSTPLLKAHSWGPITLTVHVTAGSGSTLTGTATVGSKTQDLVSNNSKTVSISVK